VPDTPARMEPAPVHSDKVIHARPVELHPDHSSNQTPPPDEPEAEAESDFPPAG